MPVTILEWPWFRIKYIHCTSRSLPLCLGGSNIFQTLLAVCFALQEAYITDLDHIRNTWLLLKINFYYKQVTKVPDHMHSGQEKMARQSNSNAEITINNQLGLLRLTKRSVHAQWNMSVKHVHEELPMHFHKSAAFLENLISRSEPTSLIKSHWTATFFWKLNKWLGGKKSQFTAERNCYNIGWLEWIYRCNSNLTISMRLGSWY